MSDQPAPTTAREALALAWELAHPIKEGQTIPKGTRILRRVLGSIREYQAGWDFDETITFDHLLVRTLDPLPEPDWLDAPAVLAHVDDHIFQQTAVFTPTGDLPNRWTRAETMWTFHWNELRDVVPLYPKEDQ